jgi:hypothetical protein
MQATILNIAKSRSNNPVSGAEPVDCFYPAIPFVDPGHDSPATLNPPPGVEMQFGLVESPAVQSGLRFLRVKTLSAAAPLGCLLVRCLAVVFDLEIRLFHWLTRPAHEHSFRQNELTPGKHGYEPALAKRQKASESAPPWMSNVLLSYEGRADNGSNEFINVALGI